MVCREIKPAHPQRSSGSFSKQCAGFFAVVRQMPVAEKSNSVVFVGKTLISPYRIFRFLDQQQTG